MEAAARAAIVCAFACMVGVFLPAGRLDVGGRFASSATSRSFYQLGKSTDGVRAFLASYHRSVAKSLGSKALDKLAPRLKGRAHANAVDVQDAIATLDELRDDDVKTVGTIVAMTMWSLLALNLLAIVLLYKTTARTARLRVAAAATVSLVTALIAIAIHVVLRTVVAEANAELEASVFTLRGGAYVIPAAAVAATLCTLAWVVLYVRARRPVTP